MTIDLTDTKKPFEPLPPGTYEVTITKAEEATAKSGNKNYAVTYKVLYGHKKGRLLTERFFLWAATEKGANFNKQKLKRLLIAVGSATLKYENLGAMGKELVGKNLEITVGHRDYDGKVWEDVTKHAVVSNNQELRGTFAPSTEESRGYVKEDGKPAFKITQKELPWSDEPVKSNPAFKDSEIPF